MRPISRLFVALAVNVVSSVFAVRAQAQTPRSTPATASVVVDLIKDVDGTAKKFIDLVKVMPADKLTWRPAAGVRSVSEVFLHVASDNYLMPFGYGVAIPSSTGIKGDDFKTLTTFEKQTLTREQIASELEKSFAHLKSAMAKTTDADLAKPMSMFGMKSTQQAMWIGTTTHLHEHLGQAIAYARSNGVTPPWSK
jgi:uncharacterized damage-inducible protein DinB